MKKLALVVAVVSLTFLAACGSGGGPANPGTGSSGFSTASFKGNYVFTMAGQCGSCSSGTPIIQSAGVLSADGLGKITSGTWDINFGGADETETPLSGTYSVDNDGTLNMTLTFGSTTTVYVATLTDPNGGYISSNDSTWAMAGVLEKQTGSLVQPTGTYVFRASGADSTITAQSMVGAVNLSANSIIADMNGGTQVTLGTSTTAISSFDSATGRGLLSVNSSGTLPAMTFTFYVVDGSTMELVSNDATNGMLGHAEKSGGAVASGNVLNGSYAFMGAGYPLVGNIQVSEGGVVTGDGSGNLTGGTIDTVFDANNGKLDATLSAAGVVTTQGGVTRDALTLTLTGSTIGMQSPVVWFVNPGRGFFITLDGDRAESGTMNVQTGAPFGDNGTFAFGQTGWAFPSGNGSQVGLSSSSLFKNASGTISGYSQAVNVLGSGAARATGTGTLSFDSTGTIGSLTLNGTPVGDSSYRFYQYSTANAFIMEVDQNVVASGMMGLQTKQ